MELTHPVALDIEEALGFPTLRRAAQLLGVDASALSRRVEREAVPFEQVGREKRLAPENVLELAFYYRRRPLPTVAGALVKEAAEVDERIAAHVKERVEQFLQASAQPAPEGEAFLAEARKSLPPGLYAEVAAAYGSHRPRLSGGAVSVGLEDDENHAA